MAGFDVFKDGWFQESLFEPTVMEAHLIIGLIPEADHAQIQIELRDPISKILIALVSVPHMPLVQVRTRATAALAELLQQLEEREMLPGPFPDRPSKTRAAPPPG